MPVVISPSAPQDSFVAAPASLATATGPKSAADASAQKSGDPSQVQRQQQPGRPAIAPGTGALVPRLSPVYHIGSLPTLFESPHSSEEVRCVAIPNTCSTFLAGSTMLGSIT